MRRARDRDRDDRGAVAVEFGLIAPLVIMLLLGTVTVALAYSQHVALSNAVREGARLGASAPNNASWLASVHTHPAEEYSHPDGLPRGVVCATLIKTTGGASPTFSTVIGAPAGCGSGPSNPTKIAAGCFVKVWASKHTHLEWVLGSADPWMEAGSVAIYDRAESCS
jgi:Flp pilus assembly pilin Flp